MESGVYNKQSTYFGHTGRIEFDEQRKRKKLLLRVMALTPPGLEQVNNNAIEANN